MSLHISISRLDQLPKDILHLIILGCPPINFNTICRLNSFFFQLCQEDYFYLRYRNHWRCDEFYGYLKFPFYYDVSSDLSRIYQKSTCHFEKAFIEELAYSWPNYIRQHSSRSNPVCLDTRLELFINEFLNRYDHFRGTRDQLDQIKRITRIAYLLKSSRIGSSDQTKSFLPILDRSYFNNTIISKSALHFHQLIDGKIINSCTEHQIREISQEHFFYSIIYSSQCYLLEPIDIVERLRSRCEEFCMNMFRYSESQMDKFVEQMKEALKYLKQIDTIDYPKLLQLYRDQLMLHLIKHIPFYIVSNFNSWLEAEAKENPRVLIDYVDGIDHITGYYHLITIIEEYIYEAGVPVTDVVFKQTVEECLINFFWCISHPSTLDTQSFFSPINDSMSSSDRIFEVNRRLYYQGILIINDIMAYNIFKPSLLLYLDRSILRILSRYRNELNKKSLFTYLIRKYPLINAVDLEYLHLPPTMDQNNLLLEEFIVSCYTGCFMNIQDTIYHFIKLKGWRNFVLESKLLLYSYFTETNLAFRALLATNISTIDMVIDYINIYLHQTVKSNDDRQQAGNTIVSLFNEVLQVSLCIPSAASNFTSESKRQLRYYTQIFNHYLAKLDVDTIEYRKLFSIIVQSNCPLDLINSLLSKFSQSKQQREFFWHYLITDSTTQKVNTNFIYHILSQILSNYDSVVNINTIINCISCIPPEIPIDWHLLKPYLRMSDRISNRRKIGHKFLASISEAN